MCLFTPFKIALVLMVIGIVIMIGAGSSGVTTLKSVGSVLCMPIILYAIYKFIWRRKS